MNLFEEFKKITHPYDDEDDYPEEYEDDDTDTRGGRNAYDDRRPRGAEERRGKLVSLHAPSQLKVMLVKPERFENAVEIADHLKDRRTVVLNLESTPKEESGRLLDFLSGVAYAGEGKIRKIAANTYIITPYHVEIEGDLLDELERGGAYF
ncbi:MAG: cell division protein SepF [Oscillibacter sp.]|nr:cell division protein SepF [Oscillibacter sp.]